MTTPKGRAMRWLLGSVFFARMMRAPVSIQARFIIPKATKPTISPAQQPRQSTPWSIPSRRAPLACDRQLCITKNNGLLQRGSTMIVLVVSPDPELGRVALVAPLRRAVEDPVVAHQELDSASPSRIGLVHGAVVQDE